LAPASDGVAAEDAAAVAGASFLAAVAAGAPIVRTFALGFGGSPPMLSTLGAPSLVVTGLYSSTDADEPSAGRFAIVGVGLGAGCEAAEAACGCCAKPGYCCPTPQAWLANSDQKLVTGKQCSRSLRLEPGTDHRFDYSLLGCMQRYILLRLPEGTDCSHLAGRTEGIRHKLDRLVDCNSFDIRLADRRLPRIVGSSELD